MINGKVVDLDKFYNISKKHLNRLRTFWENHIDTLQISDFSDHHLINMCPLARKKYPIFFSVPSCLKSSDRQFKRCVTVKNVPSSAIKCMSERFKLPILRLIPIGPMVEVYSLRFFLPGSRSVDIQRSKTEFLKLAKITNFMLRRLCRLLGTQRSYQFF